MDRDELQETFRRVNAYRHVCNAVRRSANSTLFHGFFFALVAGLMHNIVGPFHWLFLLYAGLALIEISIGLWKKLAPSVECVLVDALNSFAFGGSLVVRYALSWQGLIKPRSDEISLFIGIWVLWGAWRQFGAYRQLCRTFVERPTRAQMQYVSEMARDIDDANPEDDPAALDLPGERPIRALLAEDIAFVIDPASGEVVAVDRERFNLFRQAATSDRPAVGHLNLQGNDFLIFPLDDANWRNYSRWKGEPAAI